MPLANLRTNGDVAGIPFRSTIYREADGQIGHGPITLPAAVAGVLTTRTSATAGVITAEGHTISETDIIDIYWEVGGVKGRAYGAVVTDVTGDAITFESAAGDDLPTQSSPLTTMTQVVIDTDWDGDKTIVIAALADQRAHVSFIDDADALQLSLDLTAGEQWDWATGGTVVNPIAGHILDRVAVSHAATEEAEFRMGVLYDSTA